jgi:glucose-6-phosphate-specific signal transduction histidine kinase
MKGAIGIAQHVATEANLNRLLALQREQQKRDRELLQVEQATERVLRDEEITRASLARRKLSDMRNAIREHESAAQIVRERLSLVASSSNRAHHILPPLSGIFDALPVNGI